MSESSPDRADAERGAIIESSEEAVIGTTLDGVITSWNHAAEKLFGYTLDEAIGQPITLVVPPERRAEEEDVLHRIRLGEGVEQFATTGVTRNERRIDLTLAVSPIRSATGEIVGASRIARDVGAGGGADDVRGRLAAIVDSSDDAIVSKTLNGVITSWNRAAEKLFGYTAAEAIGQSILLIIPLERRAEEGEVLARILRGQTVDHFETVRRRKDGTAIDISLTVSPIRDALGRIVGASKIARDITDRKLAERQLATLYAESQQANRAKDEFLAMLGHELRNPLGAISAATRLLDHVRGDDATAAHACDVIARQTAHLARLVDDLLDVGRVMTGKILLNRQRLELAEVVRRTVSTFTAAGKTQQHRLVVDAQTVWVDGDGVRFEQIVGNLLTNALKYTPPGGTVRVTVRTEGPEAVLQVEDDGVGMPERLLPHVFDLFVQGERKLDRAQGGLGIGLTLVQRLTEVHGGSVEAFSAGPGCGSRFTIRLRAVPAPAATHRTPVTTTLTGAATSRRILIVEDNADSRDMLHQVLALAGHKVHDAGDGTQGLEAALRLQPDVALIDVGLPQLDGYEVARRIRARSERPDMLLVALTGYGLAEDRQRAIAAGFDLHLVKPVDPVKLLDVLERGARPAGERGPAR